MNKVLKYLLIIGIVFGVIIFVGYQIFTALGDAIDWIAGLVGLNPETNPVSAPVYNFADWLRGIQEGFTDGDYMDVAGQTFQEGVSYLQESVANALNPIGSQIQAWVESWWPW